MQIECRPGEIGIHSGVYSYLENIFITAYSYGDNDCAVWNRFKITQVLFDCEGVYQGSYIYA